MKSKSYNLTSVGTKGVGDRGEDISIEPKGKSFLCEIVALFVVVVIVWGLLLLPIIFYHLPVNIQVVSKMREQNPRNCRFRLRFSATF